MQNHFEQVIAALVMAGWETMEKLPGQADLWKPGQYLRVRIRQDRVTATYRLNSGNGPIVEQVTSKFHTPLEWASLSLDWTAKHFDLPQGWLEDIKTRLTRALANG